MTSIKYVLLNAEMYYCKITVIFLHIYSLIFFQAMTEMDVDMDALEKNPQLYKGMDLKYRPTGLFLFLRMCRTVYYSIVIITLPRYLNQNSMTFANGTV